MPFGCRRAHVVKPKEYVHKTTIDDHAWVDSNLGLSVHSPGAYCTTSGCAVHRPRAHHFRCLLRRAALPTSPGRRAVRGPRTVPELPTRASPNAAQPPGMPRPKTRRLIPPAPLALPVAPSSPPPRSTIENFDSAVRGATATARSSRNVLLLHSGPHDRPDGLVTNFLRRLGLAVTVVDLHASDSSFGVRGGEQPFE